ncbi:MAG TPA: DUF1559 domain-containing protein [Lacipirellula sp.]
MPSAHARRTPCRVPRPVTARGACLLRGFTLVELLVVIAIIGVLVALLLPAVQAAREAARRSQCQNNVKQLVYGIHLFESANKEFPAAIEPGYTNPPEPNLMHSWAPYILPYIEQQQLHSRYRFDERWNDSLTNSYITRRPESAVDVSVFLCPTTPQEIPARLDYGAICGPANYTAPNGRTFPNQWFDGGAWSLAILIAVPGNAPVSGHPDATSLPNSRIKVSKVTDGTSNTVLLGECAGRDVNVFNAQGVNTPDPHLFWADGDHAFAHHEDVINDTPKDELYSDHPNGLHLGMADASVRFLFDTVDKKIIDALATRAGEETDHGNP